MKKYLLIFFVITAATANAQWDKFNGLVYMKWGFQGGSSKIDNYFYETNPSTLGGQTTTPTVTASKGMDYKNKAIFMEIEAIKKNLIFGMRFGYGLKRMVSGVSNLHTRETTGFNCTFGYGFSIAKRISFIPTVRYNWYLFNAEGSPTTPVDMPKYFSKIGGNQRGFGLNVLLPFGEHILLRGGYYYEWIFRESKSQKGLATTPEVELYIPLDDDHIFGFAFKIAMPNRKMYESYNPDNTSAYSPATSIKSFLWEASFSIPLTGSSTSQIVTVTVVE